LELKTHQILTCVALYFRKNSCIIHYNLQHGNIKKPWIRKLQSEQQNIIQQYRVYKPTRKLIEQPENTYTWSTVKHPRYFEN
jgi:hypothetical protein